MKPIVKENNCCICGRTTQSINNPDPIFEVDLNCCDNCDKYIVIPVRAGIITKDQAEGIINYVRALNLDNLEGDAED